MENILQQIRESSTTSSPPFTRGAGGDHRLNHQLQFPNKVHIDLSDYVSKFRSPSIPLVKGEEEQELNSPVLENILQQIRESATTSSPPFTRGAGGDRILNHQLQFPNRVHINLSDYVSRFRSPSIPLVKGEEERESNSPPFTRGAGGDQ